MIGARHLWALFFASLGLWGTYTSAHWYKPKGPWAPARKQIFVGCLLFVGACLLIVVGLTANRFRGWMVAPLGICYAAFLALPCYFPVFNQGLLRVVRNVLFVAVAMACFAVATGIIPTGWLGL